MYLIVLLPSTLRGEGHLAVYVPNEEETPFITKNGRIYHMPWSPWYGRVKIDTARGERWFCSEAEALAAGWRPASPD